MNHNLQSLAIAIIAGLAGAAIGKVHRGSGVGESRFLTQLAEAPRPARKEFHVAALPDLPRAVSPIAVPAIPDASPAARHDPPRHGPPGEAGPVRPVSVPIPEPADSHVVGPGPDLPPPAAAFEDPRIAELLGQARLHLEAGELDAARRKASAASALRGSPARLAEARREEAFAAMAASLLPEAERWKELYGAEWVSIQGAGRAFEGLLVREDEKEFVVARRTGTMRFQKSEVNKIDRFPPEKARARFEAEVKAEVAKAPRDPPSDRGLALWRAARRAWEANLPILALTLLRDASSADPTLMSAVSDFEASRHLALGAWYMAVNKETAKQELGRVVKEFKDTPSADEARRLIEGLEKAEKAALVAMAAPEAPPVPEVPKPPAPEPEAPHPAPTPVHAPPPPPPETVEDDPPASGGSDIVLSRVRHGSRTPEAADADRLYDTAIASLRASPPGSSDFQRANRSALESFLKARDLYQKAAGKDGAHANALSQMIQHVQMCIYGCRKSSAVF